jgi:SAM-dependent methyltransferase
VRGEPPWDLRAIVRDAVRGTTTLLDIGTGGGEYLASLAPLPPRTFATEAYAPNLDVARARLEPLGGTVIPTEAHGRIELPDGSVDTIFARHEAFRPSEVRRLLRPGGRFVTQQVGARNYAALHRWFGATPEPAFNRVDSAASLAQEVAEAGLAPETVREATFPEWFRDVGAVVYFLRAAPWEVPGFSSTRSATDLRRLHERIGRSGPWELEAQRLLVVARRPGGTADPRDL